MGPWSFVAPRFEKQLAVKVSSVSINELTAVKMKQRRPTEPFLLRPSAAASEPTRAARPRCWDRDPPSAAARGHSQRHLRLRLPRDWGPTQAAHKQRYTTSGVLFAQCAAHV